MLLSILILAAAVIFLTSPRKTGAFKSREFGIELLILKRRNPNEKIKVYGGPDCFCDQTG